MKGNQSNNLSINKSLSFAILFIKLVLLLSPIQNNADGIIGGRKVKCP